MLPTVSRVARWILLARMTLLRPVKLTSSNVLRRIRWRLPLAKDPATPVSSSESLTTRKSPTSTEPIPKTVDRARVLSGPRRISAEYPVTDTLAIRMREPLAKIPMPNPPKASTYPLRITTPSRCSLRRPPVASAMSRSGRAVIVCPLRLSVTSSAPIVSA